jgi:outer membrane protein TolC
LSRRTQAYFASLANQRDAQVLLAATVADIYWQYRVTEERIVILNKNAELQSRSYDITRQMFEAGQQSELDLQQARTQYLATLGRATFFRARGRAACQRAFSFAGARSS